MELSAKKRICVFEGIAIDKPRLRPRAFLRPRGGQFRARREHPSGLRYQGEAFGQTRHIVRPFQSTTMAFRPLRHRQSALQNLADFRLASFPARSRSDKSSPRDESGRK